MTSVHLPADEETPLLAQESHKPTPLPWFQFSIILFLQLAEPLTSQVIYPFAPQLIRDIGITNGDEAKVGYYVGLLESIFFVAQAFTVLGWSRLSDRVGRKPIILIGLSGLSLSMYCFGLSRTFWGLMFNRSLTGALNGNIGVMRSMVAEICDPTNISQAYAYMPIAWSTGGTLGPLIGGSLSHPAEQFQNLFGNSEFLKKYPYFLPCAIPATFAVLAWLVTFIYLEESVASPMPIFQLFKSRQLTVTSPNYYKPQDPLSDPLLISKPIIKDHKSPLPLHSLLTRRVVVAAANYASVSLIEIAFRAIHPLFLATPIHLGGLGLTPSTIGNFLSLHGILNGLFQAFFFVRIHDRWGPKNVFTAGVASGFLLFALFPIISYYAKAQGLSPTVWALVVLQILVFVLLGLSYGCIFIYLAAAAPNRESLGAVNGLSQMTVSITRAIGPAGAASLFSLSIQHDYLGGWLVYYVLIAVVGMLVLVARMLPGQVWRA